MFSFEKNQVKALEKGLGPMRYILYSENFQWRKSFMVWQLLYEGFYCPNFTKFTSLGHFVFSPQKFKSSSELQRFSLSEVLVLCVHKYCAVQLPLCLCVSLSQSECGNQEAPGHD